MWVVVGSVTLIVIIATYLTWTAARVDRLHARAAAAFSALDAQSTRRAAAAAEFGERVALADVQSGAKAVLGAHRDERELAENDLTKTLRSAIAKVGSAEEHNFLDGVWNRAGVLPWPARCTTISCGTLWRCGGDRWCVC